MPELPSTAFAATKFEPVSIEEAVAGRFSATLVVPQPEPAVMEETPADVSIVRGTGCSCHQNDNGALSALLLIAFVLRKR